MWITGGIGKGKLWSSAPLYYGLGYNYMVWPSSSPALRYGATDERSKVMTTEGAPNRSP